MSKNAIERAPAVTPFVMEATTDLKKAVRFVKGKATEDDRNAIGQRRYLINSDQIVTIDDELARERDQGITRVFMSRGDTLYVPADFHTLTEIFSENGYKVYSLDDIAAKAKVPKP